MAQNGHNSMRFLCLLAMLAALFLTACDQHGGGHRAALAVKQTDIVAPPGEPSFPQSRPHALRI
jgi:hypothetical protein